MVAQLKQIVHICTYRVLTVHESRRNLIRRPDCDLLTTTDRLLSLPFKYHIVLVDSVQIPLGPKLWSVIKWLFFMVEKIWNVIRTKWHQLDSDWITNLQMLSRSGLLLHRKLYKNLGTKSVGDYLLRWTRTVKRLVPLLDPWYHIIDLWQTSVTFRV